MKITLISYLYLITNMLTYHISKIKIVHVIFIFNSGNLNNIGETYIRNV